MLTFSSAFQNRCTQNTVYEMIPGGGESGSLLLATTGRRGGRGQNSHCYWQERLAVLLLHRPKISSILSSVQQARLLHPMHAGRIVATRSTS